MRVTFPLIASSPAFRIENLYLIQNWDYSNVSPLRQRAGQYPIPTRFLNQPYRQPLGQPVGEQGRLPAMDAFPAASDDLVHGLCRMAGSTLFSDMAKRRNLKKEKQERNRAYARRFKKRGSHDGRGEGAGNGVTGTASNGGAAD